MPKKQSGFDFEVSKMLGFGRARATDDLIDMQKGQDSKYGLTVDDLRCDAEWVEVDHNGVVRKSRGRENEK